MSNCRGKVLLWVLSWFSVLEKRSLVLIERGSMSTLRCAFLIEVRIVPSYFVEHSVI